MVVRNAVGPSFNGFKLFSAGLQAFRGGLDQSTCGGFNFVLSTVRSAHRHSDLVTLRRCFVPSSSHRRLIGGRDKNKIQVECAGIGFFFIDS